MKKPDLVDPKDLRENRFYSLVEFGPSHSYSLVFVAKIFPAKDRLKVIDNSHHGVSIRCAWPQEGNTTMVAFMNCYQLLFSIDVAVGSGRSRHCGFAEITRKHLPELEDFLLRAKTIITAIGVGKKRVKEGFPTLIDSLLVLPGVTTETVEAINNDPRLKKLFDRIDESLD